MATRRKTKTVTPEEFMERGATVDKAVRARMGGRRYPQPRDPRALFEEIVRLVQIGAVELARELFLQDASDRADWHEKVGRFTEEEHNRLDGSTGGRRVADSPEHKTQRGMTSKREVRLKRWRELDGDQRPDIALKKMARESGVTEQAIRESLRAAGVIVSKRTMKSTGTG